MFPIMLNVAGKLCVVIGGGKIAYRKVVPLLEAGACIHIISPEICEEMNKLWTEQKLKVSLKEAEQSDYEHAFMVIAATNSNEVNEHIHENTKENQLVNIVSDHKLGNFHIPSSAVRGRLVISVSTGGASPALAKKIKNDLLAQFDEAYECYLDFLWEARKKIKNGRLDNSEKSNLLAELIDEKYKDSEIERNRFMTRLQDMFNG
ncbi:NAD(P)-binding protein [Peribacillus cavernae]|uniref:precorrin-2 dehydrogenase n=1 Tax=Peribacillus cavernae TaxID=1674310 RepID=A0A3S0VIF8_9BACI|nr:NAD(P)-binding protein [Peribacillus cavernae]MDQ0219113.1 precorrin-2 dehydrogenase/sirohydrochlorin ferrochelatase [Peribacillus cavernae]RUQ28654.1 NAD(P)-binding protein [Peribacillus cavernae]